MNIPKIRKTIILILLSLTPVLNIGEVFSLVRGDMQAAFWFTTPLYIKLIKDCGFLIIILLSIPLLFKAEKNIRNTVVIFLAALSAFILILFLISYKNNPVQAFAGLRWAVPFFLTAIMAGTIDSDLMTQVAKVMAAVFLISLSAQLYEFSRLRPWSVPHLSFQTLLNYLLSHPWVGGIFILYNTAGFFACTTMFLAYFYIKKCALRVTTLILIPLSLLLATSGTGIPVYILSNYIILIKGRFTLVTLPIFFVIVLLIIPPLSFLRGGDVTKSSSVVLRMKYFTNSMKEAGLISRQFGKGTNAAVLYSQKFKTQNTGLILDSVVTAIVANTGVLGFLFAAIFYIIWVTFVFLSKRLDAIIFTFVYSVFSVTAPVTEAFPMNLIFAICVAYFAPIMFLRRKETSGCLKTG